MNGGGANVNFVKSVLVFLLMMFLPHMTPRHRLLTRIFIDLVKNYSFILEERISSSLSARQSP